MDRLTYPFVTARSAPELPSDHAPLRRTDLLFILGFWTFIALLMSANTLLDPGGTGFQIVPPAPVVLAFTESYLWAAITPAVFLLASRYPLERGHLLPRIAIFICAGVAIAASIDTVMGFLRFDVFHAPRGRFAGSPLWRLQHLWFMNRFLIYIAVLAAGMARDYFLRYRARQEHTILLHAQSAQLQAQLADAQLAALRAQLNPHFLFNTLHAVAALVERDPRGVRRMIARLSELLRISFDSAADQEVPLERELTFTYRYLEIMQIRFQGHLTIHSEIEPEALTALVPNLILQPLVENAIKHGASKIEGASRIEIHARRDGERLVLRVRDNGPQVGEIALRAGDGLGLRNTQERLLALYGAEQSLTLRPADNEGVIAEVKIPYRR